MSEIILRHILRTYINILQSFFLGIKDFKDEKFKQKFFVNQKPSIMRNNGPQLRAKNQIANPIKAPKNQKIGKKSRNLQD